MGQTARQGRLARYRQASPPGARSDGQRAHVFRQAMKHLILLLFCACAHAQVAPPEHRRGPEQTFLTYPEWFLVHSPAEYAEYVKDHTPTQFPFIGHTCQFWQGYGAVTRATRD